MCLSNLQNKYSKSLSWIWNLNFPLIIEKLRLWTSVEEIAFTGFENQILIPNLEVRPKYILFATLAQNFRFLWFMPSLDVRSPCINLKSRPCEKFLADFRIFALLKTWGSAFFRVLFSHGLDLKSSFSSSLYITYLPNPCNESEFFRELYNRRQKNIFD